MAPDVLGNVLNDSMLCAGRMQGQFDTCSVCICVVVTATGTC